MNASTRPGWFAWLRLVLAVILTLALTLGYGRALIFTMFLGRPEWWPVVGVTVIVFITVLALTWRLRPKFVQQPQWTTFDWRLLALLLILWCGAYVGLFVWYLTSPVPIWQIYAVFVPSTLWVLYAAWFGYWPGTTLWRSSLLVLLLLLGIDFPLLVQVEGLSGEGRVNLEWRTSFDQERAALAPRANQGGLTPAALGAGIDLKATKPTDFPRFMGPRGDAMLAGTQLVGDWQASPPKLLWKMPVGVGWGAFAIVGDYCLTQEQQGGEECTVCYSLKDGKPVWRHADQLLFTGSLGGPGPRATPTVVDGKVYAIGASGILNCLDGATGKKLWSVDVMKDNGAAENLDHGVCGSPLVHDGKVYVSPPGKNGKSLACYDAATGSRVWNAGSHQASYSSPQLFTLLGVPQVLVFHRQGLTAHDAKSGAELWYQPWANDVTVNASQPLLLEQNDKEALILLSTGYNKGSTLLKLTQADGKWTVQPVWNNRELKAKFTSAVLKDGHVYGLDDGILCCLDPKTGKRLWKGGRYGHGQVLLAGNLLIVQTEQGPVVLVEPNPKELKEKGRFTPFSGKTWNHPALAGKLLLLRNDTDAACYELP